MSGRGELIDPERRLPALSLPAVGDGALHSLRAPGRLSAVLVLVDGGGCGRCAAFVAALAAERDAIAAEDGRVLVIVPDGPHAGRVASAGQITVLADPSGRVAAALDAAAPAVAVADPWGEVHAVYAAGEAHGFPSPGEIVEWLRYLSIQCPECQGEAL